MKNRKLYALLLCAAALVLATAGATYAWFTQNASMATLVSILPPDKITIIPVSEQGAIELTEIDLDFDSLKDKWKNDTKEEDGTIRILRPVCVKSTSNAHKLEIVRTTNMENLSFKIYPAWVDEHKNVVCNLANEQTDNSLAGRYINYLNNDPSTLLAKTENLENYREGDAVEAHAYPLYWLQDGYSIYITDTTPTDTYTSVTSYESVELDPASSEMKTFYSTYYYLEIRWKEETKQTDLFYIMAHNVAQ